MEELEGLKGEEFKIKNRSNTAYSISEDSLPLLNGVYDEDKELTITYNAKTTVNVRYLDSVTQREISPSDIIQAYEGRKLEVKVKDIDGYTLVGDSVIEIMVSEENREGSFSY